MTSSAPAPTGRRRRPQALTHAFADAFATAAESVPQQFGRAPEQPAADPPIYRALLRAWAERGRTLPGRQDPEWDRLAAPPARRVSGFPGPAADAR